MDPSRLHLPALSSDVLALLPLVSNRVKGQTSGGIVTADCLATELLRFLTLKVLMRDTDPDYIMSPPTRMMDEAWHALLLDSALVARVNGALMPDGGQVHHSPDQLGGDQGLQDRRLATLAMALLVVVPTDLTRVPRVPVELWGAVPSSLLCVRVRLIGTISCPYRTCIVFMRPDAVVHDVSTRMGVMYGVHAVRFRTTSDSPDPVHPRRILGNLTMIDDDHVVCLAAVDADMFDHASTVLPMSPMSPMSPIVKPAKRVKTDVEDSDLIVNGRALSGLDLMAPLSILFNDVVCYGDHVVTSPIIVDYTFGTTYFSLTYNGAVLDESRPISEYKGQSLYMIKLATPFVRVPVTMRFPLIEAANYARHAEVPESWTLDDLKAWAAYRGAVVQVDGDAPPADFSYTSPACTVLHMVVVARSPLTSTVPMTVTVSALTGRKHVIRVTPMDMVSHAMTLVGELTGNTPDTQRLVFAGKVMEEEDRLSMYGLTDGCVIHMVLKMRGC